MLTPAGGARDLGRENSVDDYTTRVGGWIARRAVPAPESFGRAYNRGPSAGAFIGISDVRRDGGFLPRSECFMPDFDAFLDELFYPEYRRKA